MIDYLSPSQHKMRKSSLAPPLQAMLLPCQLGKALAGLMNFLRNAEYPTLHVIHRSA
jgi:hypothetical protein